jgi:hypothetical protein
VRVLETKIAHWIETIKSNLSCQYSNEAEDELDSLDGEVDE